MHIILDLLLNKNQHIFDRLNEAGVYEEEYLQPYKAKLDEIEKILNHDRKHRILPEHVMQVLQYKFAQCSKDIKKITTKSD